MSRDTIKYIAIITMTCNHIARMFLTPGNFWYEMLSDIGYFAAVTMCFFLVEGYYYTKDLKKYEGRMLMFAVLSQIPYYYAFRDGQMNMLFNLFLCLVLMEILHRPMAAWERVVAVFLLFVVSFFCCWQFLAPVCILLFSHCRENKCARMLSFLSVAAVFALLNFGVYIRDCTLNKAFLAAVFNGMGVVASGIVLTFVYNGKSMKKYRTWNRWFFYIFYPLHLTVLCIVRYKITI